MPRRVQSAELETRTRRLRLPVRKNPQAPVSIGQGLTLEYRRCKGAGRWVVKVADGKGGNYEVTLRNVVADDYEAADGERILDFWQACDKARTLARGGRSGKPETLGQAIDSYEKDLRGRGSDAYNAARLRCHLPPALLSKPVAMLTQRDLRRWRDDALADGIKGATLLRTVRCLHACLNLAARHDRRITNRDAWRDGIRRSDITDTHNPRNVILNDSEVAKIVREAYGVSPEFGLYCEVHAVTGARSSQIAKLDIADLQDDRADPRVIVPASRKGRKRVRTPKPVPITADLAARLRKAAGNRPQTAPLQPRTDGDRWRADDHMKKFATVAKRAGIEGTIYALRHSSIVRAILANVPLRIVADLHDTSVQQIEATYSAYISHHADEVARRGLLDFDLTPPTVGDNVVTLPGRQR